MSIIDYINANEEIEMDTTARQIEDLAVDGSVTSVNGEARIDRISDEFNLTVDGMGVVCKFSANATGAEMIESLELYSRAATSFKDQLHKSDTCEVQFQTCQSCGNERHGFPLEGCGCGSQDIAATFGHHHAFEQDEHGRVYCTDCGLID